MKYKAYTKVITTKDYYGECAIYEPHPFRNCGIQSSQHTGIEDDEWCWVFYDYCGNPVGLSDKKPKGETVEKFTKENLYGNESLAEYLNKEPFFESGI